MVTLEDMRDKLMSLDEAREILAASEPLREYPLEEGNVHFILTEGWNHGLDAKDGTALVDAYVSLGGVDIQMSKDSVLQASSLCGLPAAYVKRTPPNLIEPHLNYWYGQQGIGNRPAKVLVTNGHAAAVTRQSIKPFSNMKLLYNLVAGIEQKYGKEEILVDPKFHHALAETHLRLILPAQRFTVQDTDVDNDEWLMGLSLYNSLTGKGKTSVNGYLFRWWCTNGAIDTKATSGTWTRKSDSDSADVYDWAREVVNSVLDPLAESQHLLQDMARQSIEGDVNQILADLFEDYNLPARDRKRIIEKMVEDDELSLYSLMQAVTSTAGEVDDPTEQAKLMSVGGDLPHVGHARCEACHRIKAVV
jgi:hypothetical protein